MYLIAFNLNACTIKYDKSNLKVKHMLWSKMLHIVLVVSWFSGLFYLPRIFVNLAMEENLESRNRLILMAKKLYRFTHILGGFAIIFGLVLYMYYGIGKTGFWMHAKLGLVLLTLIYQAICGYHLRLLSNPSTYPLHKSHVWYRVFNEIPVVLLTAIIYLVIFKPF